MSLSPRPYQLEGVEAVRHRIRDGKRRIVFVLATGGGKTVVASFVIANSVRLGKRVLFVAHRAELLKQAFSKLVRNGIAPQDVGIVKAGVEGRLVDGIAPDPAALDDDALWRFWARRRAAAPVQIASIDTLRNRSKPAADLVIIDECHRALAKSYKTLVDEYPSAVVLGLTATPYRADNRGLDELFEDLVVIASPQLLVEQGFLVEPIVWSVPVDQRPNLAGVHVKGGDYDGKELAEAVDKAGLVGNIVEHWQRHAAGVRTVVFAVSVEHSKHIVERFVEAGIAAEHVDGTTPDDQREAILGRLRSGATLVVSNVGVCTEGWDCPPVKCCVLARPTKSTGLYLQMAGRILRPWEGVQAVILDHAGCVCEHGFPTDERTFSLAAKKRRATNAVAPAKECPTCFAVLPLNTRVCPRCDHAFPAVAEPREVPEERDGKLVRLSAGELASSRFDSVVAAYEERWSKGRPTKPGWCVFEFEKRYRSKPPKGSKLPKLTDEQRAALAARDGKAVELDPEDAWSSAIAFAPTATPDRVEMKL